MIWFRFVRDEVERRTERTAAEKSMSNENTTTIEQPAPAAVRSSDGLGGIWRKMWGEPIWTQDHDGEVRKSRMQRIGDGKVRVKKIMGWVIANADGTVPHGYVTKWWPR